MSLAAIGRGLATSAAPRCGAGATPADVVPLLGVYAPADMSSLVRLEWRDGNLTLIDTSNLVSR